MGSDGGVGVESGGGVGSDGGKPRKGSDGPVRSEWGRTGESGWSRAAKSGRTGGSGWYRVGEWGRTEEWYRAAEWCRTEGRSRNLDVGSDGRKPRTIISKFVSRAIVVLCAPRLTTRPLA